MRHIVKMLPFLLAFVLLTACGREAAETTMEETAAATAEAATETSLPTTVPAETEETQPQEERFLLTFVGDCTFGASPVNYYAGVGFIQTVGEDYGYPFRNVKDYFAEDEYSFINLEGPLTEVGYPMQKTHTFRGPTAYSKILTENSVEFASLANNHTLDYGQQGYASTLETLQHAGIPYVERDASAIVTTPGGLKIGVYGAVYYHLDVEDMTEEIRAMKEQGCDIILFAPHWGVEKTYTPTPQQVEVGHAAIDAGADIVWGSHPHALQPIEEYGGGVIFYSLGNFSFGGNNMPADFDTALLQQEIIRASDGTVSLGQLTIVPCCISSISQWNNYQPTPYEPGTEAYNRVLEKLGAIKIQ